MAVRFYADLQIAFGPRCVVLEERQVESQKCPPRVCGDRWLSGFALYPLSQACKNTAILPVLTSPAEQTGILRGSLKHEKKLSYTEGLFVCLGIKISGT